MNTGVYSIYIGHEDADARAGVPASRLMARTRRTQMQGQVIGRNGDVVLVAPSV